MLFPGCNRAGLQTPPQPQSAYYPLPWIKEGGDLGNATLEPRQYPRNREYHVVLRVFISQSLDRAHTGGVL
jgi:hypothetical protein